MDLSRDRPDPLADHLRAVWSPAKNAGIVVLCRGFAGDLAENRREMRNHLK
jgi:hypothetical protein